MNEVYKFNKAISRFYDVVCEKILGGSGFNFYQEEIERAKGAVLEAGAGTGRILVPALNKGADIYGIDLSENMLEKLKEKIGEKDHYRVSLQDIRDFKLNKKFRLIIAPFRMFQHLTEVNDQLKALNNIYEHLEEGGKFIFDVFVPDLRRITNDFENMPEFVGEYEPGKMLKRFASVKYDNVNQILNVTFRFEWYEDGEVKVEECFFPLRYFFRYELENLAGRSRLKLENIFGGFKRNELNMESKDFVVICSK